MKHKQSTRARVEIVNSPLAGSHVKQKQLMVHKRRTRDSSQRHVTYLRELSTLLCSHSVHD